METPTPEVLEPEAPIVRDPHRIWFIVGALSLLLITAVAYFLWKPPSFVAKVWSALTLPQELRSATFITGNATESRAYKVHSFQYSKIPYRVGSSAMFSQEGNDTLTVSQASEEYLLEANGVEIVRSILPIATPSQTPDSKRIVYAQAIDVMVQKPEASALQGIIASDPLRYEIRLAIGSDGKNERIISGYAPLFIDENQFIFFAYSGLYQYDLQSGVGKILLKKNFPVIFGPVLQSPDRSLIAFADVAKNVTYVYKIKDSQLTLVLEAPTILARPALSNTALYEIKGKKEVTEIWKYDFGVHDPRLIYSVPRSLNLTRIVF